MNDTTANPRRPWFRFGLRTLFVVVTALCVWVGYEANWIRQRHQFLKKPNVFHSQQLSTAGDGNLVVALPRNAGLRAPGFLWLFGETGTAVLELPIDEEEFDDSRPQDTYALVQEAKRLFPEAIRVEAYLYSAPAGPDGPSLLASYAPGGQFTVEVTSEALAKSPAWLEDSPHPPLSARAAIDLANEMKDSLVTDSKDYVWSLGSVTLTPAGEEKWYWLVYYEANVRHGGSTGIPPHLRLVVLMDGTVPKPEIKAQ